ncbi:MAG: hypothetical protein Q4A28_00625 [Brachymonas sp.]|nr:hypothetical protein [Brachymonas sp.]
MKKRFAVMWMSRAEAISIKLRYGKLLAVGRICYVGSPHGKNTAIAASSWGLLAQQTRQAHNRHSQQVSGARAAARLQTL